ncbi:uncharacterized protein LOC124371205 [Homalodisca vitripennis]|uniref:uncharacterized protein LOC124371205 n=1 Tax=Homalodisca vitripennis TaxID=197043 RepID=UPI001EEB34C6|nr:uncharacterized protein LOC124371205 [Homalodisca vitripennis]
MNKGLLTGQASTSTFRVDCSKKEARIATPATPATSHGLMETSDSPLETIHGLPTTSQPSNAVSPGTGEQGPENPTIEDTPAPARPAIPRPTPISRAESPKTASSPELQAQPPTQNITPTSHPASLLSQISRTLPTGLAAKRRICLGMAARQGLSALLRPHSGLPTNKKLLLYKTIVRPNVTYAAPAWNTVFLRSAGLPSLHEYIAGQARAMYAVTAESPWEHIREWVTREAVHPWKIQQLKVILDDPTLEERTTKTN